MSQADSLLAHRGFTHSILFALAFPPLLAFLLSRYNKNKKMLFRDWLLIFSSGLFIHIFIDALTCYGTGWFEPFSHHRVTMNVLFVADPFYTIALLISFIALLILRKGKKWRVKWALSGVVISTCYIAYAFANKAIIDSTFRNELAEKKLGYTDYFTSPAPLNNFLWYLVAKNDTGYFLGYYSFFDKRQSIDLVYRPKNEKLLTLFHTDKDLEKLKRFSNGYYSLEVLNDTLYFNDIRFGTAGAWDNGNEPFVFRYCLEKNADNDLVIQRGRMRAIGKEAFSSLYNRIKGK
jgi:inner membrane protein